jgi:uncharacterized protein YdcH (DUF465 family)
MDFNRRRGVCFAWSAPATAFPQGGPGRMSRDEIREELIATDDEFRRLFEDHRRSEQRLALIHQKSLLSQDDEIEEKRIKVHKLALKDRMELIVRQRSVERVHA